MSDSTDRAPYKAWLLLALLFFGYVCSAADRAIISLLVEPIKRDLSFSDTQIGLLQGVAFLVFYSIAGIPAGMLVDRFQRVKLLAIAISLWSMMTALCGVARSFGAMFLVRAGIGVGEAVLSPAALSLISDVFPRRQHGLAIGIYVGGAMIGSSIAIGFGGWLYSWLASVGAIAVPLIGVLRPWQLTFMLVGLPGLFLVIPFLLFAEPARNVQEDERPVGVKEFYRENAGFITLHHAANGFTNLLAGGTTAWSASFLIRTYGADIRMVGAALGIAFLTGGIAGMIGGGLLSDRLFKYGGHWRLWVCAGSAALGMMAALALRVAPDLVTGATLLGFIVMFGAVPFSVANAALQQIVPANIRGTVSAVYYFAISIVGSGGPSVIAFVTDRILKDPNRLDESVSIVIGAGFFVSMLLYALAIKPYRAALLRFR